jgi:hypothetical protein
MKPTDKKQHEANRQKSNMKSTDKKSIPILRVHQHVTCHILVGQLVDATLHPESQRMDPVRHVDKDPKFSSRGPWNWRANLT